jgi:hypothetical protein
MKVKKEIYEKILTALKEVPGTVHDQGAKLFAGKHGTPHMPFQEPIMGSKDEISTAYFLIYATVNGKTLPIRPSIISSISDFSEVDPYVRGSPCDAVHAGLDAVIGKQVEVLAIEAKGTKENRPKWSIWMLREGTDFGFIHDDVIRTLVEENKGN